MGMTETGPTVFLMDPEHAAEKIGSVGKPQLLSRGAPGRRRWPRRGGRRAGRDAVPRPQHHARLLQQPRGHGRRHRRATAGCTRATSPGAMRTATTTSSTASRTCTSPAARTCIRPRWRPCSPTTRPCSRPPSSASPDERWGEVGHAVIRLRPGASLRGGGAARLRAHAARRLQGAQARHHRRRLPPHGRRQGAEARLAQVDRAWDLNSSRRLALTPSCQHLTHQSGSLHGYVRLRDRRRGLGGLRAGQPAERGRPARPSACWRPGPRDWHPYIHIPAGFIKTFYNSRINWCY